jgi:tRNA (guanine-N7-)-methyltransferase
MSNRVRRHADPLQCRVAIDTGEWLDPYRAHGEGDIWLDLGCGKGELIAALAQLHPAIFFIGIEVRLSIARRFFPKYGHIPNLLLLHGNANLSIPSMMGGRKVQRVLINFPDPFDHKPRYRKRQMVNGRLAEGLCDILAPRGVVSVKTDRKSLFDKMDAIFLSHLEPLRKPTAAPSCDRPALSEWEADCLKKSMPVFSREYRLAP